MNPTLKQFQSTSVVPNRLLACLAFGLVLAFSGVSRAAEKKSYTLGMIGKSQGNQFFEAARAGANAAARELGAKHGITIKIDWRTPNEGDAQKQAEYVEQMVLGGVDGIIISSSDANKLTDAINGAVKHGVPVATFDSDAPASKRFVCYAVDDEQCGERVLEAGELRGRQLSLGAGHGAPED